MSTNTRPTLHLNGTPALRLFEEYDEMRGALREALDVFVGSGPNARDYYPQGESAIYAAQREHADRIARIRSVLAEVEELAAHCRKEARR